MNNNFLEELVAEWYEFNGYFVRRNVLVGKLPKGGHECELDVVAFHPAKRDLIHIEPSMDADSWDKREARFKKKFDAGRKHIPGMFKGLQLPSGIDQIALLGFASDRNHQEVGGGRVMTIKTLLVKIFEGLRGVKVSTNAIPEKYQILRAYQFVSNHPDVVRKS